MKRLSRPILLLAVGMAASVNAARSSTLPATTNAAETSAKVEKDVIKILAEQLGLMAEEIKTTHTFKDLGMDDLDVIEVVMELEDHFKISIPDEKIAPKDKPLDFLNMKVSDLCGVVAECQKKQLKQRKN